MPLSKVYLELTNRCNLSCSICFRRVWDESPRDMSAELFERLAADLLGMGTVKSVVLGGMGEPTCAPLLARALAMLARYHLTLTTNGLDIDDALLAAVVSSVDQLVISMDGLHERFASIRGAELQRVLETIARLNQLKAKHAASRPQLALQLVISRDSIDDIFNLVDLAGRLNVQVLMVSNLIPQTPENAPKILYSRYENRDMALLFRKLVSYAGRKGVSLQLPHYQLKTERRCSFVDAGATLVGADGEVFPCYRFSHSYREYVFGRAKTVLKHSFGNVGEESLGTIWESPSYASFRGSVRHNLYPSCIDCELADGCDMVRDTSTDCYAGTPSCADCLWARKIAYCP